MKQFTAFFQTIILLLWLCIASHGKSPVVLVFYRGYW